MTTRFAERRRDARHNFRDNVAFAEFDDPRENMRRSGRLFCLSAAGISMSLDEIVQFDSGTILKHVSLRVGECRIDGSIVVKSVAPTQTGSRLGGLFYPETADEARTIMTLITGMEVVDAS